MWSIDNKLQVPRRQLRRKCVQFTCKRWSMFFFSEASRAFVTACMFSPRERAFWYFKYSSKKVANIARLPKISNVRILFTIHNGAKSTTAIDLNKRRDYHNNCQTTLVRPRFVHVSHFFTQFIFEIFLCITQAGLLCVFSQEKLSPIWPKIVEFWQFKLLCFSENVFQGITYQATLSRHKSSST